MSDPKLIKLMVVLHGVSPKALQISENGQVKRAKWIPKSQARIVANKGQNVIEIEIPEWIARSKSLI